MPALIFRFARGPATERIPDWRDGRCQVPYVLAHPFLRWAFVVDPFRIMLSAIVKQQIAGCSLYVEALFFAALHNNIKKSDEHQAVTGRSTGGRNGPPGLGKTNNTAAVS